MDTTARLNCDSGYRPSDSSPETRWCDKSGNWSGQTQTCTEGNENKCSLSPFENCNFDYAHGCRTSKYVHAVLWILVNGKEYNTYSCILNLFDTYHLKLCTKIHLKGVYCETLCLSLEKENCKITN